MGPRLSSLIARLRDHVQADGRGAGLLDPLLRAATVERGKTWPTWAYVRRRGLTAGRRTVLAASATRPPVAPRIPGLAGRLGGGYEAELHPAIETMIARGPDARRQRRVGRRLLQRRLRAPLPRGPRRRIRARAVSGPGRGRSRCRERGRRADRAARRLHAAELAALEPAGGRPSSATRRAPRRS